MALSFYAAHWCHLMLQVTLLLLLLLLVVVVVVIHDAGASM
jgi:hypothetical protein